MSISTTPYLSKVASNAASFAVEDMHQVKQLSKKATLPQVAAPPPAKKGAAHTYALAIASAITCYTFCAVVVFVRGECW